MAIVIMSPHIVLSKVSEVTIVTSTTPSYRCQDYSDPFLLPTLGNQL